MDCTIPVLDLNTDDCLGDSVGKINYNFLALDTSLCNLSSLFATNTINVMDVMDKLNYISEEYYFNTSYKNLTMSDIYISDQKDKFLLASTTVNLLSSFWGNYEFSIQLPINAVNLASDDIYLLCPTLSSVTKENTAKVVDTVLKNISEIQLNTDFSASFYPDFTIVNVHALLYNLVPSIVDPATKIDPLIKVHYFPSQTFNYNTRNINAQFTRDTVYISTGIILRFYVKNKKWNFMGYIIDQNNHSAQPNYNKTAIQVQDQVQRNIITSNWNYVKECNPINENTWYSVDSFIYANGFYSGASSKLGTITLTFRTADNKTIIFTYKSKGFNPATNLGGSDIYLEYDGNTINAYEEFPSKKTLVQTWIYPYKKVAGVNFKYSYDNKGVSYTTCASNKIA